MKQIIKEVKKDCRLNKTTIETQENQLNEAEQRLNNQEDYNRRNNLRPNCVNEQTSGETWEQRATVVCNILKDKLQMPCIVLERAY